MKILLAVRHAKSDWGSPFERDFDRPLNERGKTDAPRMAQRLSARNCIPDLIISSTANRAITTARLMAHEWNFPMENFIEEPQLYHASPDTIIRCLNKHIKENSQRVMFVCHNPGITEFVNKYSDLQTDNVPTCGVIGIQWDNWSDMKQKRGKMLFYDYPKKSEF